MGRIKQSLGVLAVAALALAGVSAGTASAAASAATPRVAKTKAAWQAAMSDIQQPGSGCYQAAYPVLAWHATKCVAAPKLPLAPTPYRSGHPSPATVGDGNDYSAQVSGRISKAVGTFREVSSNVSVEGPPDGTGSPVPNGFSLQLNTQFFTGSPACSGASSPSSCQAWQQFVYTYSDASSGDLFMQYWLINYNATCPSGWFTYSNDCYTNSNAAEVNVVTAKDLATLELKATAKSGGNDVTSLSVGSGSATSVSGKDTKVDLAAFWNTTEWGLFGDGGGSEATFGADNTIRPTTSITATSTAAPSCVSEGFTGETNNLTLAKTAALAAKKLPTMASKQTDGTPGTASCAVGG